jgi:vacuolar-type H+-ATPase subunit E/Vma4
MVQKLLFVLIGLLGWHQLAAQTNGAAAGERPKLFLNCTGNCYQNYLKTELSLLDFVRDQAQADIQLLIISNNNAGGGRLFTVTFIGQNQFRSLQDTLSFSTKPADTEAMIQERLGQTLQQGLIRYLARTNLTDQVTITFKKRALAETMVEEDKWRYWVFTPNIRGAFRGESNRTSISLDNSFSARRITPRTRSSLYGYYSYDSNKFKVNGKDVAVNNASYGTDARFVKSFSEHWSGGLLYSFYHSVYENIRASHQLAPAVEYNLFPYSENIRRQFRLVYQVGYNQIAFLQETIFDRTRQLIPYQKFSVVVNYTQTWGNINTRLNASTFLNDFSRNRLRLDNDLNVRVAEGLSVTLSGSAALINDQISLAKAEATEGTFLLGGRQLPTSFSYSTRVGLSYTFGSTNNSVVNIRLSQID